MIAMMGSDAERARLARARQDRSVESSRVYLSEKWGCPPLSYDPVNCHYRRPFADPRNDLGHWRLDLDRRACLLRGDGACTYQDPELS
jgi:hypothetical protein